jgi:hypothetical protein
MLGDPVDRDGPITSWPIVLLILVLVAIALADVSFDVAEMLGWFTG